MTSAQILNAGAGLVLAAIALAVWLRHARHPPARAVGLYLLGNALGFLGYAVASAGTVVPRLGTGVAPATVLYATGGLAAGLGLGALLLLFPARLSRREAGLLAAAVGVGALYVAGENLALGGAAPLIRWRSAGGVEFVTLLGLAVGYLAWNVATVAALVFLPLRARLLGSQESAAARSLALFAVSIALFIGGYGANVVRAAHGLALPFHLYAAVLIAVGPTLLWAASVRGAHARTFRNVALAYATVFTTGVVLSTIDADLSAALMRLLGALFLAYAVLRGQIDGLDLKVRLALGKSTLAAVFVAAFFVASETAQEFFGEHFESGYLGILAAGALVFAIAPLSRLADRIAEKAVPVAAPEGPASPPGLTADAQRRTALYTRAVRFALRNGRISPEEELHLFEVAQELGLGAGDAMRLRQEVEEDARRVRSEGG